MRQRYRKILKSEEEVIRYGALFRFTWKLMGLPYSHGWIKTQSYEFVYDINIS